MASPVDSPRYLLLHWCSAPLYPTHGRPSGDGPFPEWLNTHAPQGYRLVQSTVVKEQSIDYPEIRECLFEAVPAAPAPESLTDMVCPQCRVGRLVS